MSVHLIGGGRHADAPAWAPFVGEATERADGVPRIAVVAVGGRSAANARDLARLARRGGALTAQVVEPAALGGDLLAGVHGLLVCGGLTPAYLAALRPHGDRIRAAVDSGLPYAGFSAGAAIAAERAVIGGWRADGVPILDEDAAEDLDALTVADGLGLVPFGVDVHAAQWGTLGRLITAVTAGDPVRGVAIDEDTVLVVEGDARRVAGRGNAWFVERAPDGRVLVERRAAT